MGIMYMADIPGEAVATDCPCPTGDPPADPGKGGLGGPE